MDEALAALPEELRAPILLHYLQGYTQAEVAAQLRITQATVSRRLQRGVEELRERLRALGVVVSLALLTSLLAEHGTSPIPATLSASLGKMAAAGVGGGMVTTAVTVGPWGKIAITAALLALVSTGGILMHRHHLQLAASGGPLAERQARTAIQVNEDDEQELQVQSITNLKQVAIAVSMAVQDKKNTLPTFSSPTDFDPIKTYVDPKVTIHPVTGELYHLNVSLSGEPIGNIAEPAATPTAYEATPWPDGSRYAAYLDGHIGRVTGDEWHQLQQRWELE